MGVGGLSKQGCPPLRPLRLGQTGEAAERKAMASLVQYSKVRGTVGRSRDSRPALWPPWPQTHSQPLWPQAPIQTSLISVSGEDVNRQAVGSFQGK